MHPVQSRYLDLHELFIDDIIWVDEAVSLQKATSYIEGCKVVGVDCEWKPNYVKGSRANKVPLSSSDFSSWSSYCHILSSPQRCTSFSLFLKGEDYDPV